MPAWSALALGATGNGTDVCPDAAIVLPLLTLITTNMVVPTSIEGLAAPRFRQDGNRPGSHFT